MTIPFTTLFTGLGKLAGGVNEVNTYQGTTVANRASTLISNLPDATVDGIQAQLTAAQSSGLGWTNYLSTLATSYLNSTVFADNPLLNKTNLSQNMAELLRQMAANSQTCQSAAVGSTTTPSLTAGNGTVVVACVDGDGYATEMQLVENVRVSVTQDSTTGTTAGNERFSIAGQANTATTVLSNGWPSGSATSISVSACNASAGAGQQNQLVNNGDFETWSGSPLAPANFTITTGTAGSTVVREATPYTGSYSLGIVGTGSQLTSLQQQFGNAAGTIQSLKPNTLYAVNCWLLVGTVPTNGVFQIDLCDGSGNVTQSAAGTNNAVSVSAHTLSTTQWTNLSGVFATPTVLPSSYYLRLRLTTALDNAVVLYVDRLGFASMSQHYAAGPSYAVFSGNSNFLVGDFFTVATTNAHTNASFVRAFQRFFNMPQLQLRLPTAGSPTLSDSLVS